MRRGLYALAIVAVLVSAWQLIAATDAIGDLTLASPRETAGALADDRTLLLENAAVTLTEVVLGLLAAFAAGAAAAVSIHLVRPLRDAAYPLLVASQAIPLVVLAPLFVIAFGYGVGPSIAIVALVCFFPVCVALLDGLRCSDPDALKLLRSFGASRTATLVKLELPVPQLFSGLRIAAAVSVVGAAVGEWAGADARLGRLVLLASQELETARVYTGVVVLAAIALTLFGAVALCERRATPWRSGQRRLGGSTP